MSSLLLQVLSSVFESPLRSVLWANTSSFLASAAGQPLFAMLSEVFGQGPILILALVIATAGTGVCSGSLNVPCLVAGRLVQGAGNGGAMAVSLLLVTDTVSSQYRLRFLEYIYRAWAFGAMLGPATGGFFAQYGNWNWMFYFSYIFCALALLVAPFAIDLRKCNSVSSKAAREMDWVGACLMLLGLGSLLVGVSWVGLPPMGWNDWPVLVSSCFGGLMMVLLVLYESFWAAQPLFNLGIFSSVSRIMLYMGTLLHGLLVCELLLDCVCCSYQAGTLALTESQHVYLSCQRIFIRSHRAEHHDNLDPGSPDSSCSGEAGNQQVSVSLTLGHSRRMAFQYPCFRMLDPAQG